MSIPAFTPDDHKWMARAIHLAKCGEGFVRTNPLVGAVITCEGKLLGEGYHQAYGGLHAERNAIKDVENRGTAQHLPQATLYVTLEPCNHHGKTPPCTDIIMAKGIKRVIVCQLDPNPIMSGKSIDLLRSQNIEVRTGLLEEEGRNLNRAFYINQKYKRPYVILKYAKSHDGYIGQEGQQVWLSNAQCKILTHRWRSEVDTILVGSQTVLTDNPQLTTRHYPGKSPLRIVIDRRGRISPEYSLLSDQYDTWIYSPHNVANSRQSKTYISAPKYDIEDVLHDLYDKGIGSVLIEGGASVIQSCINAQMWDEARVISTPKILHNGVKAPILKGKWIKSYTLNQDKIDLVLSHNTMV